MLNFHFKPQIMITKNILLTVCFLISLVACTQTPQTGPANYQVLKGNIGNQEAIMHLHSAGNSRYGYVWFTGNQWPMYFGDMFKMESSDSLQLSATVSMLSLSMTGLLKEEIFSGRCGLSNAGSAPRKASFKLTATTESVFTPFQYVMSEGTVPLPANLKNPSTYRYFAGSLWPEAISNKTFETALKSTIGKIIMIKPPATDPGKFLAAEKTKVTEAWKKEMSKMTPKEASEMGMSLSIENETRLMVMFENEKVISLAQFIYSYTGGAHGNYGTKVVTLNKITGNTLTLSDVLTPEGIKMLPTLLDAVARVQYAIKNKNSLDQNGFFVKTITPSTEFYITKSGIGFIYPPYELRSFADGEITLQVPMALIAAYLKEGYK